MMDQYVTFDDLLKICSILLNLASLIFYIYYNNSDYLQKARKYGHFTGYKN